MYKKIFINISHAGFFNAGFISLSKVKKMDDCEERELLLNIFKYGLANNKEEIENAYYEFHDDKYENDDLLKKENYIKKKDFNNLLKESSINKNFNFLSSVFLTSVFDNETEEFFVSDMFAIEEVLKSIFSKTFLEEDFDESQAYEEYNELEYDKDSILKIDVPFRD